MLFNNNKILKALVYKQLSRVYTNYKNMFNKVKSNILLLHRFNNNHEIILKKNNNLLSSSLYNMSFK